MGQYAMIERELYIGRWHVDFLFADEGYDDELVLTRLYDIDAPVYIMREVNENMESGDMNTGFTFTNSDLKEALVVVGPSSSGSEFQSTFAHEAYHLAAAIASSLGIELDSETPAYITGDLTLELIDVICELGCTYCNKF